MPRLACPASPACKRLWHRATDEWGETRRSLRACLCRDDDGYDGSVTPSLAERFGTTISLQHFDEPARNASDQATSDEASEHARRLARQKRRASVHNRRPRPLHTYCPRSHAHAVEETVKKSRGRICRVALHTAATRMRNGMPCHAMPCAGVGVSRLRPRPPFASPQLFPTTSSGLT